MQGRPRCKDSKFFTYLEKTPKKHRYYVECTKCREAHIADPNEPAPELMKSRPEVFRKHLDVCQPRREDPAPVNEEGRRLPPTQWTPSLLAEFEHLLVVFQHSNRLADLFIENDATVALLTFLCPGITAVLPSRRVLGGRMLRDVARQCTEKEIRELKCKQEYYGGRVNLLSDVWQNVKKRHLLACQLSLFGAMHKFAMVQVGSRHDGLVIAEDLENQIELAISEKHRWVIGSCVTDNAGQCGRARRVLALRWPNIVFLHCFAHAVNNLVKSVLKSSFKETATTASKIVNTLNSSSAKWLRRAEESMLKTYSKFWSLLTMCETRWNSMQACFASLLRIKTALIAFHTTWEEDSEFPEVLRVLGDESFWKEVETAEQVIRPLSYASYKLQRDENTLADVVDCFGKILRGFTKFEEYRDELIKCVEQRWAECEQPLFILAYFLHPDYFEQAKELATSPLTRNINVAHFGVYYCRRLLGVESPGRLFGDLLAWREGLLASGIPMTGFRCAADYWHAVDQELEDSGESSLLPILAITVLSVAVNTATCERLFSELALIHTATRNQMCPNKALRIHTVRKHERDMAKAKAIRQQESIKFVKRVIDPREKPLNPQTIAQLRATNEHFNTLASVATTVDDSTFGPDDPVAFMDYFLEDLFDDEFEREFQLEMAEQVRRQRRGEVRVYINGLEAIERSERTPFPKTNDKDFPQEKVLTGLRGTKVSLASLHSVGDTE